MVENSQLETARFQDWHELPRFRAVDPDRLGWLHRNIAEGYCRRSIGEYIQFLYIALGSLGESVSGLRAYREAEQITLEEFELLDSHSYKIENGMLKLVESLELKREKGDWIDHLVVKESNAIYCAGESNTLPLHDSSTP